MSRGSGSWSRLPEALRSTPPCRTGRTCCSITPTTGGPAATLAELFDLFDVPPQLAYCEDINGDEHFFDTIADAFSPTLLSGHNAGFIRPEAYLAIVVVNGDDEDDGNGKGASGPYLTNLAEVTALVQGLKPDPSMVSVSYVNYGAGTFNNAQKIGQLVQATGGLEIDTSLPDWEDSLFGLFAYTSGQGAYRLQTVPASLASIQVDVNGVLSTAWVYVPLGNYIFFDPDQLPAPGSTVTVTYLIGC